MDSALEGMVGRRLDEQLAALNLDDDTRIRMRRALNPAELVNVVVAGQEAIASAEPKHTILRNPDTGGVAVRCALPDGRGVWLMVHADDSTAYNETTTPLDQAGYTQVLFDPTEATQ